MSAREWAVAAVLLAVVALEFLVVWALDRRRMRRTHALQVNRVCLRVPRRPQAVRKVV